MLYEVITSFFLYIILYFQICCYFSFRMHYDKFHIFDILLIKNVNKGTYTMKRTKHWLLESAFSFSGKAIILYLISYTSFLIGMIFGLRHWTRPLSDPTIFQKSITPICLTIFCIFLLLYRKRVLYEKSRNSS